MSKISNDALNCFHTAISQIMNESGFYNSTVNDVHINQDYSILITIGLTGRVQGYFMLQTDMTSATDFINELANYLGMEIDESDFGVFYKSTLCEIANQMSGRSTIHLADLGLDCNITPPSIIIGNSISSTISDYDAEKTFYVQDSFGNFKIFVGINIT